MNCTLTVIGNWGRRHGRVEATGHNSNENRGDTLENREKRGSMHAAEATRDSERMGKAKGKKRNADRSENLIWSLFHRIGQGKGGETERKVPTYAGRRKAQRPELKLIYGAENSFFSPFISPLSSSSFLFLFFFPFAVDCSSAATPHEEEGNLSFSHLSEVYFARWNFSVAFRLNFECQVAFVHDVARRAIARDYFPPVYSLLERMFQVEFVPMDANVDK